MDSGRIRFFLSEVWRNFTRNLVMQLTAIGTVTVTILLLGSFLFTRQTLGAIGDDVIHKIEISVFLTDSATPAQAQALVATLSRDPRVKSVVYVPKAEGLQQMGDAGYARFVQRHTSDTEVGKLAALFRSPNTAVPAAARHVPSHPATFQAVTMSSMDSPRAAGDAVQP